MLTSGLQNFDGKTSIERNCYEYKGFLGYHMAAKNAEISKAGRFAEIKLKLISTVFGAALNEKLRYCAA